MTTERQFYSAGVFFRKLHNYGKAFTEYFITQFEHLLDKTTIQCETLEAKIVGGRHHR
jgi:hypothetical protein